MTTSKAVLSIDFELFTHTPAYRNAEGEINDTTVGLESGEYLRSLFSEYDATTTLFVVSSITQDFPETVQCFANDGHEIASHTQNHQLLSRLTPEVRREELGRSREQLQDITEQPIHGFRAPAFDIADDHFEILQESGYKYDSSVVGARRIPGWYGGQYSINKPCPVNQIQKDAPKNLMEIPVSVMPRLRLPLSGAWMRFFGRKYTILGMKFLARRGITPVLYIHPWELSELPTIPGVPKRVYWRTGEWMRTTINRILQQPFKFVTMMSEINSDK